MKIENSEEMLSFTNDVPAVLSLGDGKVVVLNTGKYKDINNDDVDAIVNSDEKNPEMNMINRYDLMISLEQCALVYHRARH